MLRNFVPQLRQHLYHLQLVDSPRCEHCGREPETVTHILFRYHHYAAQYPEHLASRGADFLRPSSLLHSPSALNPLFGYVKATGRLSDRSADMHTTLFSLLLAQAFSLSLSLFLSLSLSRPFSSSCLRCFTSHSLPHTLMAASL
ncbi:hypothetical protein B0J17DRAFT_419891 [Rhizoctonia solani]|nr:hypothetical protein B0J17DRAFT_419891 [Rhizoctonia solani]